MKAELIAPCGMNCEICIAYFGYRMDGNRRKMSCIGCRPAKRDCAFIMRKCKYLPEGEFEFCFECDEFPCVALKKLDDKYRERFNMSMVENLKFIKRDGMDRFLREQEQKYRCPECGGTICVHNSKCYGCSSD